MLKSGRLVKNGFAQLKLLSSFTPCRQFVILLLSLLLVSRSVLAITFAPPDVNASSFILFEPSTATVIYEENAHERLPPASLTKIMTSYVIANELARGSFTHEDMVPVSVNAWRQQGSRMFIREGTQVAVKDLLKGIMVQSGNDASVAMAEFVAGSEEAFAQLMNQYGDKLGLKNTHFTNATGLPDDAHYTTAYDLAILAAAMIEHFPEHYEIYKTKEFTYNKITQRNRNLLLWRDSSVDGVKTGHTQEAGYCLVASSQRDGMRLISVVMGTSSAQKRAVETQKLLKYGFRNYELTQPFANGQMIETAPVWMGQADQIALGLKDSVSLVLPKGSADKLATKVSIDTDIKAPVNKNQVVGSVIIDLDGKVYAKGELVALDSVAESGFFKSVWHWFYLKFLHS